jgi:hypothetical protein
MTAEKMPSDEDDDGNPPTSALHRPILYTNVDEPVETIQMQFHLRHLQSVQSIRREIEKRSTPPAPPPTVRPPAPPRHPHNDAIPSPKECGLCLCAFGCPTSSEDHIGPTGSLQPVIVDCDVDSPAKCTHMICQSCRDAWEEAFLKDANIRFLECIRCKESNATIRRRHVDMNVAQYMVDPATFAFKLTTSRSMLDNLRSKADYMRAFGSVYTYPAPDDVEPIPAFDDQWCPHCNSAARGPVTAARLNLARCSNTSCMMVFCVHCRRMDDNHGQDACETLLRKKAMMSIPFDATHGRACPYPRCDATNVQHYRGDGCHIVECWKCHGSLCFACGAPKRGGIHDAFEGRTCGCAIWCGDSCTICTDPPEVKREKMRTTTIRSDVDDLADVPELSDPPPPPRPTNRVAMPSWNTSFARNRTTASGHVSTFATSFPRNTIPARPPPRAKHIATRRRPTDSPVAPSRFHFPQMTSPPSDEDQ